MKNRVSFFLGICHCKHRHEKYWDLLCVGAFEVYPLASCEWGRKSQKHAAQNTVLKSENAVRTQISFEMDLLNMIFKRSNFTWYSSCLKKVMSTS